MTKTYYPELDEVLYQQTMQNGLRVIVNPRKGFTRKIAYFVTDFGSMHRDFTYEGETYHVPAGVAHYLEHKMFDMPDKVDITEAYADLGASVNAFTSYDITAYYFACTDYFETCLELLLEFVSTPYFTQESVDKERGIIDQEIGMNVDSADTRVFENLMTSLYNCHPIREPILGTRETIRQITPEILHICHKAFYTPGNMMLCVVGDVDPEEVLALARKVLGDEKRPVGRKLRLWQEERTVIQQEISDRMDVVMPTFQLGFKCRPVDSGEASIRLEMVADLAAEALFGEASSLYLRLYEQGLLDSSFGGGYDTIDGAAMLLCSGDSENPQAVREAILEEARRLVREGIPQEEFLAMKRSALGRRIRGLDGFDSTCFRLCAYSLDGFDYFRFPELYRQIEAEELLDFISREVIRETSSLSIVYPGNKEEKP